MSKTILILAANPKGTSRLRLDQEVREINNGLQRSRRRDEFVLKPVLAARPVDVRRAMLDLKPNIVHFCGHGSGEAGIAFEDESGNTKLVNAEALEGFFELFADIVECVVLNACYSEVQAEAIAKYIHHVVGMKKGIGDTAAIEFAVAFYDALGAGKSFEFAYKLACNAIQWAGILEHLIPTFKSKANAVTDDATGHQPIPKPFDVFLSYSRTDASWVTRLKSDLEQRGIRVWFDRDQVRPGGFFVDAIEKGLIDSRTFILVVSPDSIQSNWAQDEYYRALSFSSQSGLHIIPVLINNAIPPDYLSGRQCIDFSDKDLYQQNINRLIWPGITGKFVAIGWVLPELRHHNCTCYDRLCESSLFKLITQITSASSFSLTSSSRHEWIHHTSNRIYNAKGIRRVLFVNLFQDILCLKCSAMFSPKHYADFIFSTREVTRETKDEVVFVLFNKTGAFGNEHDLDVKSQERLEHYFTVNYDKDVKELEPELRDLWNNIQRLFLSTEQSFVTKTFVRVSRISVSEIYPDTKHIKKMRVDFLLNCFVKTDLIAVYFENDDLVFSFKNIPVELATSHVYDEFFEVQSDDGKFILIPTGHNGTRLSTSRRINLNVASAMSNTFESEITFRLEFI